MRSVQVVCAYLLPITLILERPDQITLGITEYALQSAILAVFWNLSEEDDGGK